ncbi:hypothetical protein MJ1HA_0075 [Metallosphaera sedula]|nr:hypothetical protein MJ1HA_0075 [Metallosphaera sedula]
MENTQTQERKNIDEIFSKLVNQLPAIIKRESLLSPEVKVFYAGRPRRSIREWESDVVVQVGGKFVVLSVTLTDSSMIYVTGRFIRIRLELNDLMGDEE